METQREAYLKDTINQEESFVVFQKGDRSFLKSLGTQSYCHITHVPHSQSALQFLKALIVQETPSQTVKNNFTNYQLGALNFVFDIMLICVLDELQPFMAQFDHGMFGS